MAEVFEPCGHAVSPRAVAVPGRPGAALLGGEVGPRVLRVRLYWDFLRDCDEVARAEVRHAIYAALLRPGGGVLRLPGDPQVSYRDVVCTGCGSWSSLFADGSAEVEFTCFDPVGFGAVRSSSDSAFVVGGSWATWPVVECVAVAGGCLSVSAPGSFLGGGFASGSAPGSFLGYSSGSASGSFLTELSLGPTDRFRNRQIP